MEPHGKPADDPAAQTEQHSAERKTPTSRGEPAPGHPPITPYQRFQFEHQKARFAYYVAGGAMALALLTIIVVARSFGKEEKVFVLDAAGNTHYGPMTSLSKSTEMLQTISVLATQTIFSRSAAGFDLPEFIKPLFQPIAQRDVNDSMDAQLKDLKIRSIHQSPMIEEIKGPVASGFTQRMEVTGKLIRAGSYSGRNIYEEAPFKLLLNFTRNPSIGETACYPWVVASLEITVQPAR